MRAPAALHERKFVRNFPANDRVRDRGHIALRVRATTSPAGARLLRNPTLLPSPPAQIWLACLPDYTAKRIHELLPRNWHPENVTAHAARPEGALPISKSAGTIQRETGKRRLCTPAGRLSLASKRDRLTVQGLERVGHSQTPRPGSCLRPGHPCSPIHRRSSSDSRLYFAPLRSLRIA